jgi:5'-nucleotidase
MTEPAAAPEVVVDEHRRVDGDRARLLITNDDGIESPGLRALAHALAEAHDVVVVTPAVDASGSGTSIGRFGSDGGVDLRRADFDGVAAYALASPPGLAVTAAALGAFGGPPDLVVSGINAGINTGHSVIHSGTVGAVLTARTFGSGGIAVSLDHSDPWQWETAATIAVSATGWMLARAQSRFVLNVNVPALPLAEVAGIRWAELDRFGHFRVATADVERARLQFDVAGSMAGNDPASDTALCRRGYVTLTLLSGVEAEAPPIGDATEVWPPLADDGQGPEGG